MSGDTRRESGSAPLVVQEYECGVLALTLNRPDLPNALERGLVLAPAGERSGNAAWSGSVEGLSQAAR